MASQTLTAGFARKSITPKGSVPLAGYGNTSQRMSENVLDEITVTCLAFTKENETFLILTQDLIKSIPSWVSAVRCRLTEKTGVPGDCIMICSTHTHSAPDTMSELDCIKEYQALYLDAVEAAALEALEDRAEASFFGTRTTAPGLAHVRHYRLADGTFAGPNFGHFDKSPIVDHQGENDSEILLLKLVRPDKPALLLINFQVHPTCTSTGVLKTTDISADFVGVVRKNVEASTKMKVAYFTGAAGNQVVISNIGAEKDFQTFHECRTFGRGNNNVYGWLLSQRVLAALPELRPLEEESAFSHVQMTLEADLNHEDEDKLEEARRVVKLWRETDRPTGNALANELGLSSVYHAGAITGRASRPAKGTMELNAFRVGPLAFVTFPYETFAAHGKYVKVHSPFPMTMIFSCANGAWSYVPTREAYEYGCYESFVSYFAKGTGETVAEKMVDLLESLK